MFSNTASTFSAEQVHQNFDARKKTNEFSMKVFCTSLQQSIETKVKESHLVVWRKGVATSRKLKTNCAFWSSLSVWLRERHAPAATT